MRMILNIIWVGLGGFWLFCGYILAGLISFLFIITIPAGLASFRIAGYVLWPFGRRVVDKSSAGGGSALMNIVWFFIAGWWLALGHVITAFAQAVTIIGLPMAWANLKLIPLVCFPFGKEIVAQ